MVAPGAEPAGETPRTGEDAGQWRLLVEAISNHAIYRLDPDGFVRSWSSGAERINGYAASDIVGQHFSRFYVPEDRAGGLPDAVLATAATHGHADVEGWRVRKDGSRFWAAVAIDAIRDASGALTGFAKVTRDITERRAVEQALAESERRFRLLIQGVTDYAIYMLDPNGVVVNWNSGAERIKGYLAAEILGQHFSRFYTREDRTAGLPARALETAVRDGRFEGEGWRIRKDGSRFWASVVIDVIRGEDGGLIGFAKVTRDITQRRAAQDAILESERQFRLLVNGVTDYALYMLDLNGIVTSWNIGAQRIKGYASSEIIGRHFSQFYTEGDRAAGIPGLALRSAAAEGRYEAEGWRLRKDGTLFWSSVVIDPIYDENGTLIGFAKITRDVTERRNATLAMEKAREQLAHSQRLEALGRLTGGVAHDFNNLLMIVGGHVRTVKRLLVDQPKGMRAAQAIETAAKRGATLTRQLLSFSRQQRLNPASVQLIEHIESMREMLSGSASGGTQLTIELPPRLWPVLTDVSELELALVNLVVNARDAMPKGGRISIAAQNATVHAGQISDLRAGDFVALTVADTGEGIPEDILPRIFDPFFTTKSVDKGTGLGLSQVHGFAHQAGGAATVSSVLGAGTQVTIYLPRATQPPRSAGIAEADEAAGVPGARVLLVEDNPQVAEVSADLLNQLGYKVEISASADAALDRLRQGEVFDLVLSDIVMAGLLDGIGLARAMRERRPRLPVLLATGYSRAAESVRGEFPILRKPYDIAELSRAIAVLLRQMPSPSLEHGRGK